MAVSAEAVQALGEEACFDLPYTRARTHSVAGRCIDAMGGCRDSGTPSGPVDTATIKRSINDMLQW